MIVQSVTLVNIWEHAEGKCIYFICYIPPHNYLKHIPQNLVTSTIVRYISDTEAQNLLITIANVSPEVF